MPAAAVLFAHGGCLIKILTDKCVQERGLSDTGRAEKTVRLSSLQHRFERIKSVSRQVAQGDDRCANVRLSDGCDHTLEIGRADEVTLAQKYNRFDPPFICHDEVSFQPAHVEIEVARLDDEGPVDV
jgi:hypothetical protein